MMDLNASPGPEDVEQYGSPEKVFESSAGIARREREERRKIWRLKNELSDVRSRNVPQQPVHDLSRLPAGWLGCPPVGQEICGIIPSKVPLGENFYADIPPGKRYSFKQVLHQQKVSGRQLGLVIDLTNTTRYYSTKELQGINHIKIQCRGRDAVPENAAVNQFVYEVMQFLFKPKRLKTMYVLVHCTHGHNRTGYMIVHFLMRTQLISVTQAISKFAEARPPGIYKPDYIDALYAFYHEMKPANMTCPAVPEWKRSTEFDLNGEAVPDEDDPVATSPFHNDPGTDSMLTNDDVLGDDIPNSQLSVLRQACKKLLKIDNRNLQFPGSHPVSLNSENLQQLRQRYYYATWKADGTRYMMLITVDGCYLIDRRFNFRRVQMRFPCRRASHHTHHFTLLDGEMVIDTDPKTGKQQRRYLIYDLMALNDVSVVDLPFRERWNMIEKELIELRNAEKMGISHGWNPSYRYDWEPFSVRRKNFWLLSTVGDLLNKFIPNIPHKSDGLIFQEWDDKYVPNTHHGLLKWKFPEMNSVDFLFEVSPNGKQLLYVFAGTRKELLNASVVFEDEDADEPSSYAGKIIECAWDSGRQVWKFLRERPDKDGPNQLKTFHKIQESIRDNITSDQLLEEISKIIRLPMYVDRIQKDIKAQKTQRVSSRMV